MSDDDRRQQIEHQIAMEVRRLYGLLEEYAPVTEKPLMQTAKGVERSHLCVIVSANMEMPAAEVPVPAGTIAQQLGSEDAPPMKFYQLPVGARFVFVTRGIPHNEVYTKKDATTWGGRVGGNREFRREDDPLDVMIVED